MNDKRVSKNYKLIFPLLIVIIACLFIALAATLAFYFMFAYPVFFYLMSFSSLFLISLAICLLIRFNNFSKFTSALSYFTCFVCASILFFFVSSNEDLLFENSHVCLLAGGGSLAFPFFFVYSFFPLIPVYSFPFFLSLFLFFVFFFSLSYFPSSFFHRFSFPFSSVSLGFLYSPVP